MADVLSITSDGPEFAQRLRELLEDRGLGVGSDDLDELGLIPALILAGASVTTDAHAHGDSMHVVRIGAHIGDELEDAFYATLDQILVTGEGDEHDHEGHDH